MDKKIYIRLSLITTFLLVTGLYSNAQKNTGNVVVRFENLYEKVPLELKKKYKNGHGETVEFTLLSYFISNISLTRKDGSVYVLPVDSSYFLVKQTDQSSRTIRLNQIPAGKYRKITFTIGVDSLRNTMDISKRTGALDMGEAARGMYWAWNSGYIFFKMEGISPQAPEKQQHVFQYHIGGFGGYKSKTINNIKIKDFELGAIIVSRKKTPSIPIYFEVDRFFEVTPVKERSNVMWGDFSVSVADHYNTLFNCGKVTYEK